MSTYARLRELWIHRERFYRSPTTGQQRLQSYEAIPFRGEITQVSQSDVSSNDRHYNKAGYTLTTYYRGVRKGDVIVDGEDTYTVQFADRERPRGPYTMQLERMTADG